MISFSATGVPAGINFNDGVLYGSFTGSQGNYFITQVEINYKNATAVHYVNWRVLEDTEFPKNAIPLTITSNENAEARVKWIMNKDDWDFIDDYTGYYRHNDNDEWKEYTFGTEVLTPVQFWNKCDHTAGHIWSTADFIVSGDISSLVNFHTRGNYQGLFKETKIVSASDLKCNEGSYTGMFKGCTSLINAPSALLAEELKNDSYFFARISLYV